MTIEVAMHNVRNIEVRTVRTYNADSEPFYTRRFVVTDKDGKQLSVLMYADSVENLGIQETYE